MVYKALEDLPEYKRMLARVQELEAAAVELTLVADTAVAEVDRLRKVRDAAEDFLNVIDLRRVGVTMHAEERRASLALRQALEGSE